MAAVGKQVACDDTATEIIADRYATITNQDATNSVFIGGANVTAATGYELKPNDQVQVDASLDPIYGICAATKTARVDVIATRRSYR